MRLGDTNSSVYLWRDVFLGNRPGTLRLAVVMRRKRSFGDGAATYAAAV